jgi:hypothetical protein
LQTNFGPLSEPRGPLRATVCFNTSRSRRIDACAWSRNSRGPGGLARPCAGCHATSVEATGSRAREGLSPDTTLHSGPDVAKVRSLTDLCGLRAKVETYNPPKGLLQCKCSQRITQHNCGYSPTCGLRGRSSIWEVCHSKAAAWVLQLRRKPHCKLSWLQ